MIDLTASIDLPHDPAAAWLVVADYAQDPLWRTGVVAMSSAPTGLATPGATTAEELRFAGRTMHNDGVVTGVETGRSFTWKTTSGADAHGSRTVLPLAGGGCRVTLALHVEAHGIDKLFAPLLARMLQRNLGGDLERLSDLLDERAASVNEAVERTAPTRMAG